MRAANRKALKPQPTHQAKLVVWHLMYRVPLYWAAIPDTEIAKACERFNLPLEIWLRQERTFGLLKKVYSRRAQLRGQQPLNVTKKPDDDLRQQLPSNNEPINNITAEQPVSEITEQPLEIPAGKPEQQPLGVADEIEWRLRLHRLRQQPPRFHLLQCARAPIVNSKRE